MRLWLAALLFVWNAAVSAADTNDFYHQPEPLADRGSACKVKLVYLLPQDRPATAHYREKIGTVMAFVADLYREDFKARGYAGGQLDFAFTGGQLDIALLRSTNGAAHFADTNVNSSRQWPLIKSEVERAYGPAGKNLYVVFAETYGDGPAKVEWPGGIALGARFSADGGLGIFSAWILRDEFCATNIAGQLRWLADATPIVGRTALHAGRLNSPRFEFIEDGFGAVAHELGHALGLPHDLRQDTQFIMGNGFRYLRHNYLSRFASKPKVGFSPDNARMLRWTRFLGDQPDLSDEVRPQAKVSLPATLPVGATEIVVTLEASDDRALGAVLFTHKERDTVIGGDDLSGRNVTREIKVPVKPLQAGPFNLRATLTDRSGNVTTAKAEAAVKPVIQN